jgi:hypothetical protein
MAKEPKGKALARGREKSPPGQSLDFYIKARNGRKRNYIFDYSKAKNCSHPQLVEMAIGGTWYRCTQCNYALCITSAYMQPVHNVAIGSLFNLMHFSKEFGMNSLNEVVRRPIGQLDGTLHKPVIPEGMSLNDALAALEEINVNDTDGGKEALRTLLAEVWVGPKEKEAFALNDTAQLAQLEEGKAKAKQLEAEASKRKGERKKKVKRQATEASGVNA